MVHRFRVSLEVMDDGVTPKAPSESMDDGLPKLYIHHAAFMKGELVNAGYTCTRIASRLTFIRQSFGWDIRCRLEYGDR